MTNNVELAEDLEEVFLRLDASEARQSALEARQARIERLLMGQTKELQQVRKALEQLVEQGRPKLVAKTD